MWKVQSVKYVSFCVGVHLLDNSVGIAEHHAVDLVSLRRWFLGKRVVSLAQSFVPPPNVRTSKYGNVRLIHVA